MSNDRKAFILYCIALFLIALLVFCGCRIKNTEKEKKYQAIEVSQVASRVITKSYNTVFPLSADTAKAYAPWYMLQAGHPLVAETNGAKVMVGYNPETGNIEAIGISKGRNIPIQGTETTVENSKTDLKAESKEQSISKESTADVLANVKWIIWVIIGLVVLYYGFKLYLKIKNPLS